MQERDVSIYSTIPVSYANALADWARMNIGADATIAQALRVILPPALGLPPIAKIYRSQADVHKEQVERRKKIWECYQRLGTYAAAGRELGITAGSVSNACNRHLRDQRLTAFKMAQKSSV